MKKQRTSFTLVELLIVIGIIALLAGLVMPAIASARASARTTACISNQGQTMKIITQAMNDNNQFLVSGNHFDIAQANLSWNSYLLKNNRLTSLKAFRCTSLRYNTAPEHGASTETAWESALQEAYGVVESFRQFDTPAGNHRAFDFRGTGLLRVTAANPVYQVSPGALIIGACATQTNNRDVAFAGMNFDNGNYSRPTKLHGDDCNFFFLDGHAESLNKDGMGSKYAPREPGGDDRNPSAVSIKELESWEERYWLDPEEED